MDDILNIILKDTYTLYSAKHRVRILKSHLSEKFFGKAEEETLEKSDMDWLNSLPSGLFEKFTQGNILSQISELEKRINQTKALTLYLAFEVNEEATRAIALKARELFQSNLLLDIKYNPALLAGCGLVWNGVYKDLSLRARIEENKSRIIEMFRRFVR